MYPVHLLALLLSAKLAEAVCECGYVTQNPEDESEEWLFSDSLETNFTDIKNIGNNGNWERKEFNVSAQASRGNFVKAFLEDNVDTQRFEDDNDDDDDKGAGLKLRVSPSSSGDEDGAFSAELDSTRNDFLWGSYRAGMKASKVGGTCAAFFYVCRHGVPISILPASRFLPIGKLVTNKMVCHHHSTLMIPKRLIWNFSLANSTLRTIYTPSIWSSTPPNQKTAVSTLAAQERSRLSTSHLTRPKSSTSTDSISCPEKSTF